MIKNFDQLYYYDSYQKEFEAKIEEIRRNDSGIELRFDQTVFYPEGGGQPGDRGEITLLAEGISLAVVDTVEDEGSIWHRIGPDSDDTATGKSNSLAGKRIQGRIDWHRRYDFMQQHSAEHIFSGLVNSHFGYDNVGFHLNEYFMTIDFNGELSDEDLRQMENLSNVAIRKCIPFQTEVLSNEEAVRRTYRSKLEVKDQIRLITVPGYDCCACCGTQVRNSGEIGQLKVIDAVSYKRGMRLHLLAGERAQQDYLLKHDVLRNLGKALSAPLDGIEAALRQRELATDKLKAENRRLKEKLLDAATKGWDHTLPDKAFIYVSEVYTDSMKELTKKISGLKRELIFLYASIDDQTLRYSILASEASVADDLLSELKERFDAKGGGRNGLLSGQIRMESDDFKKLEAWLADKNFPMIEL